MPLDKFVELKRMFHIAVDIGNTSTSIIATDHGRCYLLFVNDSDTVIYLALESEAIVNQGIRLNAEGGSYEMSIRFGNLFCGPINAIHGSTGTKRLLVTEGNNAS